MEKAPIGWRRALLLTLMLCVPVSAPSFAEHQQVTLQKAFEFSLRNNGDLKGFREERGIRDAATTRARLLPNPTVELEVETGALTGNSSDNTLSIGISQEFLTGGKRDGRLTVAGLGVEIHRWQLADRERTLREEVTSAFLDVLLAQERLKLMDRSIELNRQLLEVTRERLAAGDIPELEMNLARVELTRSEGARLEIERGLQQARSRLCSLMGLDPADAPGIDGALDGGLPLEREPGDLKRLALGNRPDLKALETEASMAEAEIALARSESVPNLTAGIALRRETAGMEIGGIEGRDTSYSVGLRLSIPLPLFDTNQAGIQEATARRGAAGSRLAAARRNIEREVESAYATLLNAGTVLSLYRSDIIPQLGENLKLMQEAYRLGEVGILSVMQEQKKFFEVSDGYLTALHARQLAVAKLESAVATEIYGGAQ